jgi:hypothetical protein
MRRATQKRTPDIDCNWPRRAGDMHAPLLQFTTLYLKSESCRPKTSARTAAIV